jgi:hypothetical protein
MKKARADGPAGLGGWVLAKGLGGLAGASSMVAVWRYGPDAGWGPSLYGGSLAVLSGLGASWSPIRKDGHSRLCAGFGGRCGRRLGCAAIALPECRAWSWRPQGR